MRARRSAQEWVRDSNVRGSNWSQGLQQYHPDGTGMATLQTGRRSDSSCILLDLDVKACVAALQMLVLTR